MSLGAGTPRLGEILLKTGQLREADLRNALEHQRRSRKPLGEILVQLKLVSEENLGEALSQQHNLPFVRLSNYLIDPAVASVLPEELARRLKAVPLFHVEKTLTLAITDPANLGAIDSVRFKTGLEGNPGIATASDILNAINQLYGLREEPSARPPTDAP